MPDTPLPETTRADVVQSLLNLYERDTSYLEIGVSRGKTFHKVIASRKVAVDPKFRFDVDAKRALFPNSTYRQVTSDAYFGTLPPAERFDVIYLDGLHVAEQTLRDLMAAIAHLAPDGAIVIDDIFPSSFVAALPDASDFERMRAHLAVADLSWMGDIYKLVFFIETFMQSWTFRCVEENHGQLIMWRLPRANVTPRLMQDIANSRYEDVVRNRDVFQFAPLQSIVALVKRSLRSKTASPPPEA